MEDKETTESKKFEKYENLPVLEAEKKICEEEDKKGQPSTKLKRVFQKIFSIRSDIASHETIREKMISGAKVTGINSLILLCAIIIASIGLNLDSVAVIIGAMLISPLMGTIMGIAYGTVAADKSTVKGAFIGFSIQVSISLIISTLYFLISPIKEATPSLLARTSPTYYDVIIAFTGGVAGVLAQTRKNEYSNVIPGVAIATALMPPLCTCGWAIANAQWQKLWGALYLFVINGYFIYLATVIMLAVMAIPKVKELTMRQWKKVRFRITITTFFPLIPFILLSAVKILQLTGIIQVIEFKSHAKLNLRFLNAKKAITQI